MKFRIGIAAASLALVASGCGGSDAASGNLGATVLAAATNTTEAESSKASMTMTINGASPEQIEPVSMTMDGNLDYSTAQGSFTVNLPAMSGAPASSTEMIVDNTSAYMKLPVEATAQFNNKSWLKIDVTAESETSDVDLAALSAESGNPADGLEMLSGISDDVVEVGKEDVRGEKTTRYSGTLDFSKAAEKESDQAKKDALLAVGKLYGGQPLPVNVWLNKKDRVVKMTFSIETAKMIQPTTPDETVMGTVDFSMEFYDFGTDVDIQVPPADQVITEAELEQLAAA
jgi:hypothetical protein